jgi:predicted membrane protein
MKMGAGLFWGIILIVIGLSIIFRIIFDINIFRIVIAIIFILIGIKILIGRPFIYSEKGENNVIFGERRHTSAPVNGMEYNTIFSKTIYDFTGADLLPDLRTGITFNTIFGSTEIILPPSIPVKIKTDAVFSAATMPNGNSVAFGNINYSSPEATDSSTILEIRAHVVFGGLKISQ